MSTCTKAVGQETLGKEAGSDNVCSSNFVSPVVTGIQPRQRAPKAGLHSGRYQRHSIVDRFWARVQKPTDPGGCWIFAGAPTNRSGHIYMAGENGERVSAHRLSYTLHHGPIPKGYVVMHACDVGACVNPAHLSVGTQRDNIHDAMDKGRFAPWLHPNTIAAKHAPGQRRNRTR